MLINLEFSNCFRVINPANKHLTEVGHEDVELGGERGIEVRVEVEKISQSIVQYHGTAGSKNVTK